jgi:hypothetical protein
VARKTAGATELPDSSGKPPPNVWTPDGELNGMLKSPKSDLEPQMNAEMRRDKPAWNRE